LQPSGGGPQVKLYVLNTKFDLRKYPVTFSKSTPPRRKTIRDAVDVSENEAARFSAFDA
jgi:hypothetical protein